ncbi:MAG: hypothetical protein JWO62_2860 [Acidimicrobiaceae bacterium]|jgi:hypothetical protein|nr:hypothetical protein [Acidimicrobiaceae bacterium]
MAVENESERPVGWYVSRVVNLSSAEAQTLGLLGGIVTPDGAALRIGEPVLRERLLDDHQSYAGTLSFPGLLPAKLKVELVVTRFSGSLAEVGLRPVTRVPQRRIGADRYFEAAWAVLEGIAQAGQGAELESADRLAPRVVRRFARAS